MKTVRDLEELKNDLSERFPDAIRGSAGKSNWDNRRKILHLDYWVAPDDVGGRKVLAKGDMLYFIEWSASNGEEYKFAENDYELFLSRLLPLRGVITRMVGCSIPQTELPAAKTEGTDDE